MIKNGYSNSLAKLLLSKYLDYLEVNVEKTRWGGGAGILFHKKPTEYAILSF
ncbi:MAG TPA: hypothetical protein PK385_01730 [Spirochaetota bacterium]|nr:hypothetical protein [Spirochaetota bacterium]HOS31570.1 hypothetical protein [Spirochaetota bacterium]HOS54757.1 hypothetical protein [Spirochaetota bacterium]HPK62257.1 hypothetical protein [Spirochaetota bacterium]HQF77441.1 hypothetical protein [Spirochaetota bacterium]